MIEYDLKKYGNKVRALREEKKLTQAGLAELSGLSISNIGKIERGTINYISLYSLLNLCDALSASIYYLLELDEPDLNKPKLDDDTVSRILQINDRNKDIVSSFLDYVERVRNIDLIRLNSQFVTYK